jgi:hypothetical protein
VRGPGLTIIFVPIQQMVRVSLRTVTMQIAVEIKDIVLPDLLHAVACTEVSRAQMR